MKKFASALSVAALLLALSAPTFAAQRPKGTEGPDVRMQAPKGTEGPDVRMQAPKGIEGPDVRRK